MPRFIQPDQSQERSEPNSIEEAWDFWAEKFRSVGLDPAAHIVNGNKKDNFWMMGETGPCGPCSELHVDLTPAGDTKGSLVNAGSDKCIEIWNLVFIQFNAEPDGPEEAAKMMKPGARAGEDWKQRFVPLPAKHVDTGMGLERVVSIIQGTKDFTDFANAKISNYETDVFRPLFDELEKMSGKKYGSTLPAPNAIGAVIPATEDEKRDVAFRVIADHIRTLSFAVADGIQPSNDSRGYVLRRILRRAVRYGRTLGFREPFFYKLTAVLARTLGDVFPEIRAKQSHSEETLRREEEQFNRTLDRGIKLFENDAFAKAIAVAAHSDGLLVMQSSKAWFGDEPAEHDMSKIRLFRGDEHIEEISFDDLRAGAWKRHLKTTPTILGEDAFKLYDTYGFPLDLTELMARERSLAVDAAGFEALMEQQRARARASQKKEVIELSQIDSKSPTHFIGYDHDHTGANVLEVAALKDRTLVVLDNSVCYAEMGGQVGDTGELDATQGAKSWRVANTQKSGDTWLHFLEAGEDAPAVGDHVSVRFDRARRRAIERHHSVTHILHWALHEVVSREAVQKGSFVGPDKLTFDFSSAALTPAQLRDIERLVNERLIENEPVSWTDVPYAEARGRADIMQIFGDKYGDRVRVVQIGGEPCKLDGWSMELCAGTHVRRAGEIGLFRIVSEGATGSGVRRIEAVAGAHAAHAAQADAERLRGLATLAGVPLGDLEKRIEAMLTHQKELEKSLRAAAQREAAARAKEMLATAETIGAHRAIIANLGALDGDALQAASDAILKVHGFEGVVVLGGSAGGAVSLVAGVAPALTKQVQAGKIIQAIAPIVGGKGGGRPDSARGGGRDASKLDEALAKAKTLL